ncbi:fluoride efflux transporter CrcB [Halobacillus rhizosphaerae]|uniref:fluoride efflux transporter CrcB n=1 Tax=Halobacillus rhizosphaerae TaxID=3064889 RepID=UPI00398B3266
MTAALFVGMGGFLGAIARFGVSNGMKQRTQLTFPLATFVVNMVGSFFLGMLIGLGVEGSWYLFLGTGFMGSFTTFSTFKLENIQLHRNKQWKTLALFLGLSYTIGIFLAFIGMVLGNSTAL